MSQRIANTLAQQVRDLPDELRAELAPDDVPAHRQRQPVPLIPPLAKIQHLVQAFAVEKQLPLMDQQTGVAGSVQNGVDDFVKRDYLVLEISVEQSQGKKRTRQLPGNRNLQIWNVFGNGRLARNDDRTVVVADRSAVRQQRVLVSHVRIGVKADGSDVVRAAHRFLVQRLNVLE